MPPVSQDNLRSPAEMQQLRKDFTFFLSVISELSTAKGRGELLNHYTFPRILNIEQPNPNSKVLNIYWKEDGFKNIVLAKNIDLNRPDDREKLPNRNPRLDNHLIELFEPNGTSHIYDIKKDRFVATVTRDREGKIHSSPYGGGADEDEKALFLRLFSGRAGGPVTDLLSQRLRTNWDFDGDRTELHSLADLLSYYAEYTVHHFIENREMNTEMFRKFKERRK
jgi:hypothetical protein